MTRRTDTEKAFKNPLKTCRKINSAGFSQLPHTEAESNRNWNVHLAEHLHLLISQSPPKSTLLSDIQKTFQLIPAKPSEPVWCLCKEVTIPGQAEPTLAQGTGHHLQGEHQCQHSISLAKLSYQFYLETIPSVWFRVYLHTAFSVASLWGMCRAPRMQEKSKEHVLSNPPASVFLTSFRSCRKINPGTTHIW